ncbi:GNAT family N-acetyltransferase [Gallionella capsiferriformans]|uniref:N-acetyltransferase domain-containing protein n=1 Tax=Gallionella capsiferriformans (strain ES-2) TaxID=395494 RepID=D9SEF5_GALCS|nr:GNAT family N-acetyltransferase [Gallionella capsiferriformans]ADL54931.1 hypothetical protein Galf_0899 [Gallionella capsiferriformans ES-2]MDP1594040.1 GNAT family N-acetyltransferase [Gallionella sp.]MDP1940380.1 GNAT family N-acetyltransferase [Gallionella sp.]
MRFLLDTNILIPLEDSRLPLSSNLANFVRLAREYGHQLVFHPASKEDISRDENHDRRLQTLERLAQYTCLEKVPTCPWNTPETGPNDKADNEILYALACDAADALITEDKGIQNKAKRQNLEARVYAIQTAEDLLRRLHETTSVHLPNIQEVPLHSLTPELEDNFFDGLRLDYPDFGTWFRAKAREQRKAWLYRNDDGKIGALCIYAHKENEIISDNDLVLNGASLKLCTFIVAPSCRGKKIGELFLKAAFRYATSNRLEHIFIHGNAEKQSILFELLTDFGFVESGTYQGDIVYLKKQPEMIPEDVCEPFEYCRRYFPHFRQDSSVRKFIIPIRPEFHRILFSDYDSPFDSQMALFESTYSVSNAIKQAYLCNAQIQSIKAGDIVLFYRSIDEQAVTSLGIVEHYESHQDVWKIVRQVRRRTVYSIEQIAELACKPTKVMLFRLVKHFLHPPSIDWLQENHVVNGSIQSIREINDHAFQKLISKAS